MKEKTPNEKRTTRIPLDASQGTLDEIEEVKYYFDAASKSETIRRSVHMASGLIRQYKINKDITLGELLPMLMSNLDSDSTAPKS